ncbi:MAG TPA: hypothetical protein VIL74_20755 [Pyrinomonadaceae bacterium]|jgi:hypothetical protein
MRKGISTDSIMKTNADKCLRHRLKATARFCDLCEAKRLGKEKFEAARRLFINRNK